MEVETIKRAIGTEIHPRFDAQLRSCVPFARRVEGRSGVVVTTCDPLHRLFFDHNYVSEMAATKCEFSAIFGIGSGGTPEAIAVLREFYAITLAEYMATGWPSSLTLFRRTRIG